MGNIAISTEAGELSTFDVDRLCQDVTEGVARRVGDTDGVAFLAHQRLEVALLSLALFRYGRTQLPIHPKWVPDRQTEWSRKHNASLIDTEWVTEVARAHRPRPAADAKAPPTSSTAVLATSGTEGPPKGVVLTSSQFEASAAAHARHSGAASTDRVLLTLPLAHVGGMSVLTRGHFLGATVVIPDRIDPESIVEAILRHRTTHISLVPTQLHQLLAMGSAAHVLRGLTAILVGGANMWVDLRRRAADERIPFLATYGMTESCSQLSTQTFSTTRTNEGTDVGKPLPSFDVRVRSHGKLCKPGEAGTIGFRGPARFLGYAGGAQLATDAYFDTPDHGYFDDDGRLHVLGRIDDGIITGGENVHPTYVEGRLLEHPEIQNATVFGIDDPVWGQAVAAVCQTRTGSDRGLVEASRALASFEKPRWVCLTEDPTVFSSKVNRKQVARDWRGRLRRLNHG